jgi:hypothetical protein
MCFYDNVYGTRRHRNIEVFNFFLRYFVQPLLFGDNLTIFRHRYHLNTIIERQMNGYITFKKIS